MKMPMKVAVNTPPSTPMPMEFCAAAPAPDEGGLAIESVDDDQAVLTTDNSCSFSALRR